MIVLALTILSIWIFLSLALVFNVTLKIVDYKRDSDKRPPAEIKVPAKEILDSNPGLEKIIRQIIGYELSANKNDAARHRLAILKAKLKFTIKNPVVRQALLVYVLRKNKNKS